MKNHLLFAGLFSLSAFLCATAPVMAEEKALSRSDVQAIIKDYLSQNPEVVMDALKKYQAKQEAEQAAKAKTALKDRSKQIYDDSISPVAGNPKGDVTLVEFFDYHCGYCKKVLPEMTKLIKEDPNVRIVFKELPILSPDSELAARAALAVYMINPDKYFAYHTALMGANSKFDEAFLTEQAEKVGIDAATFKKGMAKPEVDEELKKNKQIAAELGIQGTPAFIMGGQMVPGYVPYEEIKKAVTEARKKKS